MSKSITNLEDAVRELGALPMPVGPAPKAKPRTMLDHGRDALRARMAKDDLRLVLENVITYAERLEAQVAELREERHTTNEALTEAAEALRVNRDRIAGLERVAVEARSVLAALCHDLEDPGSDAFGALFLLSQATVGMEAQSDETAKVIAHHDAEVLRGAAAELMAACPEHGDADEVWMDCPCEYADELERKAVLIETGAAS